MSANILRSLAMQKYARILPRIFPGATRLEIHDRQGNATWHMQLDESSDDPVDSETIMAWSDFGPGIQRRQLPCKRLQFRTALQTRDHGDIGWLTVTYDLQPSVPMATAPDPLQRAFRDAKSMLQEELDLQSECNQLAVELTERYEELNLVYSTQDQVTELEEGHEALSRLVHNCADYLDVGLAALICRDRNVTLHSVNSNAAPDDVHALLEVLQTTIYDWVESQVACLVLNESNDMERQRLWAGRTENVLAHPVIDAHGTAVGIIAVIAREEQHVFSNGDRNLLEVMAKKASRIMVRVNDSLTGLMNRNGFEPMLVTALGNARSKNATYCLLHIDVDQLHVVNDLMGHQEGDSLIRRVAKTLKGILRESD